MSEHEILIKLNSNGNCVFCLNDTDGVVLTVVVTKLLRFMGIKIEEALCGRDDGNEGSSLTTADPRPGPAERLMEDAEIKISLCPFCVAMVRNFENLDAQHKLIETQMENQIHQIHRVVATTERNGAEMALFRIRVQAGCTDDDSSAPMALDILRHDIMDKCGCKQEVNDVSPLTSLEAWREMRQEETALKTGPLVASSVSSNEDAVRMGDVANSQVPAESQSSRKRQRREDQDAGCQQP